MYHDLPRGANFWSFLFSIDQDLAKSTRQKGCSCGGPLHCANFPRKPRGGENLPKEYGYRRSFCCARDSCRKRTTPPSVRFLGRKVYLGVVVILVAAMRHGPSPRRVAELSRRFGADRHTIARWQVFWREHFPQTPFWKVGRAHFVPAVDVATLPQALLDAFLSDDEILKDWERLLCFLAPISLPGAPAIEVSR